MSKRQSFLFVHRAKTLWSIPASITGAHLKCNLAWLISIQKAAAKIILFTCCFDYVASLSVHICQSPSHPTSAACLHFQCPSSWPVPTLPIIRFIFKSLTLASSASWTPVAITPLLHFQQAALVFFTHAWKKFLIKAFILLFKPLLQNLLGYDASKNIDA